MEKPETLAIIDQLRRIQEMDVAMMRRREELEGIPQRKAHAETALAASKQAVATAHESVQNAQSALRQNELEIEAHKQQIAKFRNQQFQIKSNTEYRALNNEIAHIEGKISQLEDKALQSMEEMDRLRLQVRQRDDELAQAQAMVSAELSRMDERSESLSRELQEHEAERGQVAEAVPADWLQAYERIMANKQDQALVPMENNTSCGGCHMKLPAHVMHDVRKAAAIITCVFCGRMLFEAR
ncbi:MAG: zinc ribbon domain-containing protein [Kiritimatiellia bacterium]|nr:C4-type zinc ribbon domain-containing protein [Lentisphaerota bacterium]